MSSRISSIIPGTGTSTILTKEFGWASIFSGSVWTSYVAWSCRGCALWSWVGDVAPLPCADTSVDWHPCVVSPCSAVEPPTAFPLCGHWCVDVPAGTHQCALRCPGRMASGTKRQLCAVLVLVLRRRGTRIRQSGTVELRIQVPTAMNGPHFMLKHVVSLRNRSMEKGGSK